MDHYSLQEAALPVEEGVEQLLPWLQVQKEWMQHQEDSQPLRGFLLCQDTLFVAYR